MANINPLSVEYFESFAKEIEGKFNRIKYLTDHGPSKGDYHEEVLRSIIRNFLTKRFSVKKGFIYRNQEEKSSQIDIMVVDENHPAAYVFQEGDFAVVMPEAVVAIVEVKTTLDASQFDEAIANIARAKSLYQYPTNLAGLVFGFGGTTPSDETLDGWFKRDAAKKLVDNKVNGPDGVMFFNSGCFLARHTENGEMRRDGNYYHKIYREINGKTLNDTGWHLSILLAMLVSSCELANFNQTHTFGESRADRLIQAEGSMRSHNRFLMGEGMSTLS